jgi:hypothetical protein
MITMHRFVPSCALLAVLSSAFTSADPASQDPKPSPAAPAPASGAQHDHAGDQDPAPRTGAINPETDADRLLRMRRTMARDVDAADREVREVDIRTLKETDRQSWVRLARDIALRRGDRARLVELQREDDAFSEAFLYRILFVGGLLTEARFDEAKAELEKVGDPERVNERDRRRYWALHARIAQMEGDLAHERHSLMEIVRELDAWPKKSCQGCHDDKKRPDETPILPILDTWFGKRLVAVTQAQGTSKQDVEDAQKLLAADPHDDAARIRLAYALVAAGDRAGAEAALAPIPWAMVDGRTGPSPRMMTAYP